MSTITTPSTAQLQRAAPDELAGLAGGPMSRLLSRLPDRARHHVGTQLALGLLAGFVLPTMCFVVAGALVEGFTRVALYLVAAAYVATCTLTLLEANPAFRRRRRPDPLPPSAAWEPDVTLLVVAYLPNEVEVVVESLNRLHREVQIPGARPQILLAYNTPTDLPIENELRAMAAVIPALDLIRVEGSRSKAENVMGALPHVRGEVVAILDTDHHLRADAATRAVRWFDAGYDVVQGRCVVRNARTNLVTRLVALEFETIYGIAHCGRSLLVDTGVFGGANGWWRTAALREVGLDHRMLTEDIDSSLRALMSGLRIVHDRSVISTELAPETFSAWWRQRTRWAQGWFQVTVRHARAMRRTPVLPRPTRIYWGMLLTWRELFPFLSLQVFTILLADVILGSQLQFGTDPFLLFSTFVTLSSGLVIAAAAWRMSTDETREQVGWRTAAGCALLTPPYTLLRNAVAIAAMVRELVGDRRWLVTRRTQQAAVLPVGALTHE
ncbi:MAG: glycosyltransferase family 2 protein [Solirubrobacteraceae bacterium]|nr:glycosyltransferase family 2 protein [Solirubrobacteraceae bacterium]